MRFQQQREHGGEGREKKTVVDNVDSTKREKPTEKSEKAKQRPQTLLLNR